MVRKWEINVKHDNPDLCKVHQWLFTGVNLHRASTKWKLFLWWFACMCNWKDLASCFPHSGHLVLKGLGQNPIPILFHSFPTGTGICNGCCIEWSSSCFSPKSDLLIHLELCPGNECDNVNILCFSTPSIVCSGKSDVKEWSGKDCVSWKQKPAVKEVFKTCRRTLSNYQDSLLHLL